MNQNEHIRARIDEIIDTFESNDGALWRALEQIAEAPHRKLVPESPLVSPADATAIAPGLLIRSILEPDAISITMRRPHFESRGLPWRILKVYDDRNRIEYDTVPNRFTAHLLRMLLNELRRTLRKLGRAHDEETATLVDDVRWLRRRLRAALEAGEALTLASSLREVPHGDLVLGHDARYRRVMEAWVALMG